MSAKVDFASFLILVMDVDGGGLRKIQQPADADNIHPTWSPDGRTIVFTSGERKAGALWRFTFAV